MHDSSLPRGLMLTDIPGNSPQDEAFATRMEAAFELLDTVKEMIEDLITLDFPEEFDYVLGEWIDARGISQCEI